MKNTIILEAGADGGNIKIGRSKNGFFYSLDETSLLDLVDDLDVKNLKKSSDHFKSFDNVLSITIKEYNIFNLTPLRVNKKYISKFRKAYLNNSDINFNNDVWESMLFQPKNLYDNFSNLDFNTIENLSRKFSAQFIEDHYTKIYPFFKNFLSEGVLDLEKFVIGTNMVYAWMPTILHLELSQEKEIVQILNKLNNKKELTIRDFELLKNSINNSIVGMSKFLHFVNPNEYPILDSRIYDFIKGSNFTNSFKKPELYLAYKNKMKSIIKDEQFISLYNHNSKNFKYKLTPMRYLEMLLFYAKK